MSLTDERAVSFSRTEKDVVWSDLRQSLICLHCGNLAIELAGVIHCQNDPDCLNAMQEDAQESCAEEGHTYAVFAPDA